MKYYKALITLALAAASASVFAARADHLLISEVLIDAPGTESDLTSAEFIEIYNPTNTTVNLGNYYLVDYPTYYLFPAGSFAFGTGADYILKFPATASLAPGQVAVLTQDASNFLSQPFAAAFGSNAAGYFAQTGSPLLFEIVDGDASVPQIENPRSGTTNDFSFAKTNGGEFAALIYWDGQSDLVSDVDAVRWGAPSSGNQPKDKNAIAVDGPDVDTDASTYKADSLATVFNFGPTVSPFAAAMERVSAEEPSEVATGGNGITGHDEYSEDLETSFDVQTQSGVTPGLANAGLQSAVGEWNLY